MVRLQITRSPDVTQRVLLLCLFLVLMSGCDQFGGDVVDQPANTAEPPSPLTVNVIQVNRVEQAIETAVFFGTLEPNRKSRLGFGRAGRVKSVFKLIGEQSVAGEKLAELEQDQLENQKSEVEQKLLEAQQALQPGEQNPSLAAQQQITLLESQLREIDLELAKGIIAAPYDCLIAEKNLEVGDLVSPSTAAIQVIEDNGISVITNLPRKIADALNVGQSVWVGVSGESVSAQIKTKSPVETSAGSKTVTLQVTGPMSDPWTYGQTVEIRYFIPTKNSGFWIPLSALTEETNGLWSVLTVKETLAADTAGDNRQELVQKVIEIIQLEDEWALASGALVDGEMVVVSGTHRVVSGQPAKVNDVTGGYKIPGAGANE